MEISDNRIDLSVEGLRDAMQGYHGTVFIKAVEFTIERLESRIWKMKDHEDHLIIKGGRKALMELRAVLVELNKPEQKEEQTDEGDENG